MAVSGCSTLQEHHMSGVLETLAKSVKRSLKAILGKDLINEEVMQTLFTEAERTANSRSLTRNVSSSAGKERQFNVWNSVIFNNCLCNLSI